MSVLDRKLRRDLLAARGTIAAILLVVVVGVLCFVGMASAHANLERSRRAFYAECRMADFTVELKKAPAAEAQRVGAVEGVAEVEPRIVFDAVIDLPGIGRPVNGRIISLPAEPRPAVNSVVLRRGTYFTGEGFEEVILNDAFARAHGLRPGGRIHVILNDRRQELLIAGTAISSEFVYLIEPGSIIPEPENYGVLYLARPYAEEILDFEGACNQIVGLLAPDAAERPAAVLRRIEAMLEPYGVYSTTPRSEHASHRFLADEIRQLRVMSRVVPAIFLGVAALVMNILMTRLAEQQRVTIGTLKALGYGGPALLRHYLEFGIVVGILGAVAGIGLGLLLTRGLMTIYRDYFEFPLLGRSSPPSVVATAVLVSLGFAILGTLHGVRSIMRLGPAEAMRLRPPAAGGAIALERWRGLWARLGFRGRMAARSVWRHRWRTAVGVTAAAAGSAQMFLAFHFVWALDWAVDFQFQEIQAADIDLVFREDRDRGALLEAARLPGVDRAEPLFIVPCEFARGHHARKGAVTGVAPGATLTVPRDPQGRRVPIPPAGLVMSRTLAGILGARAGDEVTLRPVRGRRDPHTVRIARVTDSFIGIATYADIGYLTGLLGEAGAVSSVQLKVQPGLETRRDLDRRIKVLPAVAAVNDLRRVKASLEEALLENIEITIGLLVVFAGSIFFGSILTTSLVAIAERKREVATFRALGYEPRQVGGIFLRESLLVNLSGAALGLPLGLALTAGLVELYNTEVYRLPLHVGPASFLLTFGLSAAFTLLAHAPVQRAIDRLEWRDALGARE